MELGNLVDLPTDASCSRWPQSHQIQQTRTRAHQGPPFAERLPALEKWMNGCRRPRTLLHDCPLRTSASRLRCVGGVEDAGGGEGREEGRICAERWWAPGAGEEKGERKDTQVVGGRTISGEYCLVNVVYNLFSNVMCCQRHSKESFVWRQQQQLSACAQKHNSRCFVFVITTHAPEHFDMFALPHL